MAKYRSAKSVPCYHLVVILYLYQCVGEVLCDGPLKADTFVGPIERSNLIKLVENRSEDPRIEESVHQPVRESILLEIQQAAGQIASEKCRDDISLVIDGIRQHHHWALQSKKCR